MKTRKGKALKPVEDGHPRRIADGKNAWRKMTFQQRQVFIVWIRENGGDGFLPPARTAQEYLDQMDDVGRYTMGMK